MEQHKKLVTENVPNGFVVLRKEILGEVIFTNRSRVNGIPTETRNPGPFQAALMLIGQELDKDGEFRGEYEFYLGNHRFYVILGSQISDMGEPQEVTEDEDA